MVPSAKVWVTIVGEIGSKLKAAGVLEAKGAVVDTKVALAHQEAPGNSVVIKPVLPGLSLMLRVVSRTTVKHGPSPTLFVEAVVTVSGKDVSVGTEDGIAVVEVGVVTGAIVSTVNVTVLIDIEA